MVTGLPRRNSAVLPEASFSAVFAIARREAQASIARSPSAEFLGALGVFQVEDLHPLFVEEGRVEFLPLDLGSRQVQQCGTHVLRRIYGRGL